MSDIATSDSVHGAARETRGVYAEAKTAASAEALPEASGFWWRLAGVAWVGAVLSYVWGRYDLPFSGEAWAAARERVSSADWMLILAAILAPLVLLAVAASLWRNSRRLSAESRSIAEAARRMSDDARAVAPHQGEGWRAGLVGEVEGANPAHIRREVERATHAIGALHHQMKAIEEALASQSAALDDAAERAEARAKTIAESLRSEREALQGLVSSIEADGGRAMNLVALRPGDMEKTQRTLDALKSQSDAIERTVEAAGVRLNAIAAEIQQALRKAGPADAQSLTDGARASVREAAHHAIGAIGETEAATRARLFDGEALDLKGELPGILEEKAQDLKVAELPLTVAEEEAADLRRRNLTDLRRQMDRLRRSEEEAAPAAAPSSGAPSSVTPSFGAVQPQSDPAPGQSLAARLASAGAAAAGLGGAAAAAVSAKAEQSREAVQDFVEPLNEPLNEPNEPALEEPSGFAIRQGGPAALGEAFETAARAEAIRDPLSDALSDSGRIDVADLVEVDLPAEPSAQLHPEPRFEPAFSGLNRPPEGADQPPITWEALGDFDAELVETEPLDRDAAALAAHQAAAKAAARAAEAASAVVAHSAAAPEIQAEPAAPASSPRFEEPDSGPAPLFGDPTPPRAMSFDLDRLAPLADLSIPSPLLALGGEPPRQKISAPPPQPQPQPAEPEAEEPPAAAAPATPLFQPVSDFGGGGDPAARGWLGAASPGEPPAGGLDSFGERREVEAASTQAPPSAAPPRPAIVWRQPETPMFGARALPRPKPLDWEKAALGLNFPVSEEDTEAEEALYEVSIDHQIGALIQASEDMLAVLVELKLYMEDHQPRIAPPEVWRAWLDGRSAAGDPPVVEIGPAEALSRVRDLIDHDPAVERLAVSFAGRFEELIRRALDESADPSVVTRLADTRTGRAYAMVACAGGRVE